jgi:phosphatidyl-myo-inositol dimannoside synthase
VKILIFTYELPPIGGGGGQTALYLAEKFSTRNNNVKIITSHFGTLPTIETREKLSIIRVPCFRTKADRASILEMIFYMVSSFFKGLQEIIKEPPNVIFSVFSIPSGLSGLLLSLLARTPHIVSLQGGDVPGFLGRELQLAHRITMPLTKFIWRKSYAVVSNSEGLKLLAKQSDKNLKGYIFPMGVDTENFYPEPVKEWNKKVLQCVFVGRLVDQKQPMDLVKIGQKTISKLGQRVRFHVYGDGPLKSSIENYIRQKGIQDQIILHGWKDFFSMPKALREADIFIQTSRFEGMSAALLQAFASGLVPIVYKCFGQEMILHGENGFIIENNDLDTVVEKICLMEKNRDFLAEMAVLARATAEKQSWENISELYLKLFDKANNIQGV